ncbi:MAG TPA: beta-glucosidase, partial [Lachnospiraceae bacterium]|nr:beta-glucosidase [Lachnospiraceae bacterium]
MATFYASKTGEVSAREKEHSALVRELAGECMTLLENDGTLPLAGAGKVAVYGNGVRHTVKGGTGSGDVNTRTVVTIEQGLKEAGFEILTGKWL